MTPDTRLLGEVVRFVGGGTPDRSNPDYWDGSVPWATVKDFNTGAELHSPAESITQLGLQNSASNLVDVGTVVIPTRMALGKAAITLAPTAINQDLKAVIPTTEELDTRYLLRYFLANSQKIEAMGKGATVKGVTLDQLRSLQIPCPPLPEQRRIAAILDKADALRAKRRQAIAKLDLLLQSVFLEMFGDPVTNPKGWPMVHVGDAFSAFVGGKNVECPDSGSSPYRILKVSAVTKTVFMPDQSKLAPDGLIPASEHIVRNGDLLFSRANTAELVAATAYVWETPPNLVLPDKIWRMVLRDESKLIPLFAWELFKNRAFRDELSKRSSGTSGSMKNISKAKLMLVPMPLPPLELQNKLALLSRRLHQQRAWLERQQSGLDQVQTAIATSAFAS